MASPLLRWRCLVVSSSGLFSWSFPWPWTGAALSSGSPVPLLSSNTADYGGGVYVGGSAALLLYSTSTAPFGVVNNVATTSGAGISLWSGATLCANDYNISGNLAPQGSAIDAGDDAAVYLNSNLVGACPSMIGAVHCTTGATCNAISQNAARRNHR